MQLPKKGSRVSLPPSPLIRRAAAATAVATLSLSLSITAVAVPGIDVTDIDTSDPRAIEHAAQQASAETRATPPARATDATRPMDAAMEAMVARGAIGVTGRVHTPALQWSGAAGRRDLDGSAAVASAHDRFRAGSITKPMIATLVLQEIEAGVWTLDTTANSVIPNLFPEHPGVTLRQLLSHTSGAPNGTTELLQMQMTDPTSYEQLLAAIGQDYTPQQHIDVINAVAWGTPGQFFYSNAGYVALGMLVETQNGRPVADLLRDRVWRPAGMRNTSYPLEPGLPDPALHEDAWIGFGWLDLGGFDPDFFLSAGAVVTTTQDLNAFTRALITGHLVDRALVDEMIAPVLQEPFDYGLGIFRLPDPCAAPGTTAYLYGHDGAAFGTVSIALTSADGTRQLSLAGTGRDLSSLEGRWGLNEGLIPLMMGSCSVS